MTCWMRVGLRRERASRHRGRDQPLARIVNQQLVQGRNAFDLIVEGLPFHRRQDLEQPAIAVAQDPRVRRGGGDVAHLADQHIRRICRVHWMGPQRRVLFPVLS